MIQVMTRYIYKGPVMEFGRCVDWNWSGETCAESEKKALSNLAYQYKKQQGKAPNCKVSLLPEKLKAQE